MASDLPQYPFARPEKSYEPPAELKKLRDEGPTHKVQLFDGTPACIVTRHKEVCDLLASDKFSNDRYNKDKYPEIHEGTKKEGVKPTFVHMDDPTHAKHRREMTESFFTKSASENLAPQIEKITNSLLDKIVQTGCKNGPVDLVSQLAAPLNPKVILECIYKVPPADVEKLINSNTELGGTSGSATEAQGTDLHQFISDLVDERIKNPGKPKEDLVSKLVVEQVETGTFDKDDLVNLVYMIFVAGNTAITESIALGVLSLLQHPDQLEILKKDPSAAEKVVEETLRYHTPSALNSRRVSVQDTKLGGHEIKANTGIIGSVRSANRDERVYPNPDKFDMNRQIDQNCNLAFGYGPHNCQGQWLSRLELVAVFRALFQKLPNLKLARDPAELEYTPATQNVGVTSLPVVF
ncbi:cytochrome P450 [Aspergillus unguis]